MQSTNEELETSKEELQSLNEELHTANLRLTKKSMSWTAANSDLRNLFESTQIATIFLDRHLIIRSFTPAIATLYNLIPSDRGRPLTDIVSHLQYTANCARMCTQVLSTLQPLERRITRDDRAGHYIMRILPYREPDSTVSGVLVTFIDVTTSCRRRRRWSRPTIAKTSFWQRSRTSSQSPGADSLRSPAIAGLETIPWEQARAQAIIARQVAIMSTLLDDLLDVSRITRGAFLAQERVHRIKGADGGRGRGGAAGAGRQAPYASGRMATGADSTRGRRGTHNPSDQQPAHECHKVHPSRGA